MTTQTMNDHVERRYVVISGAGRCRPVTSTFHAHYVIDSCADAAAIVQKTDGFYGEWTQSPLATCSGTKVATWARTMTVKRALPARAARLSLFALANHIRGLAGNAMMERRAIVQRKRGSHETGGHEDVGQLQLV